MSINLYKYIRIWLLTTAELENTYWWNCIDVNCLFFVCHIYEKILKTCTVCWLKKCKPLKSAFAQFLLTKILCFKDSWEPDHPSLKNLYSSLIFPFPNLISFLFLQIPHSDADDPNYSTEPLLPEYLLYLLSPTMIT